MKNKEERMWINREVIVISKYGRDKDIGLKKNRGEKKALLIFKSELASFNSDYGFKEWK